jgi:polysaccharide deacetylase family protein (PEP-CTERM system associated)
MADMRNSLTVDLEEYYQATAFSSAGTPAGALPLSRVERNTERILTILAESGHFATFFVVGSIADRFPKLIERIAREGHELACHSFAHRQVFTLTRDQFYQDTRRAKLAIEDAGGVAVKGYRAPSFSITRDTEWVFDVLVELGFTYDSSVFPVRHLNFMMPNAPRDPFIVVTPTGSILELPMSTVQIAGGRAPLAGGAYLRLLPYWYTQWAIRFLNTSELRPACVYLHPWELDADQPRMKGSLTARLRHYCGLRGTEGKLRRLLHDFKFQPLGLMLRELDGGSLDSAWRMPRVRPAEIF